MGIGRIFKRSSNVTTRLRGRLDTFLKLVTADHRYHSRVSELTTLMEKGQVDFGALQRNLCDLVGTMREVVEGLNALCDDQYRSLTQRIEAITENFTDRLRRDPPSEMTCLTVPFDRILGSHDDCVGWKSAQLGEMRNRLGLPVPDGFAITAAAYSAFLTHNGLEKWIKETIESVNTNNYTQLIMVANRIQQRIRGAEVPEAIAGAVMAALDALFPDTPRKPISVRSSGVSEGTTASFAGQYASFLNVSADQLLGRFKDTVASRFSARAIYYLHTRGFDVQNEPLPVCCMEMVEAAASGVVHSVNLDSPDAATALVSASWGFGEALVGGHVTPDHYEICKTTRGTTSIQIGKKDVMFVSGDHDHSTRMVAVEPERQFARVLDDDDLHKLVGYAIQLETHFNYPVSLEWAKTSDGKLALLQCNMLEVEPAGPEIAVDAERNPIMHETGKTASRGVGWGPVYIMHSPGEIADLPKGAILVSKQSSPQMVPALHKAAAIVTETGSSTGHLATVAREFGVPMICGATGACQVLRPGLEVTVDATHHKVYRNRVDELLSLSAKQLKAINSPAANTLKRILFDHVLPLNLIDPGDAAFAPENCQTFHDITRFCHQKGLEQMFFSAEAAAREMHRGVTLEDPRIPLMVYVMDLGGGLKPETQRITPDAIDSRPFAAFWEGMTRHKWPNPQPLRTKGFFSVVARTVADPTLQNRLSEKTLAIITHEYLNVSLRLGYHISNLEALCRPESFQNYIRYHFHGGAAAREKRLRRCQIIATILNENGFSVQLEGDTLDALLKRARMDVMLQKLQILGQLTSLSKQLDMTLHTEQIATFFLSEFRRKIYGSGK